MNAFSFALGAEVRIQASGETGVIVGRAEYTNARNAYLLRYKASDGRAVEQWWSEEALSHA